MASTIKLKNSTTAGNTPSSLETGEVAINVADGNLFYGSASAVLQNFVVDELEVKGNLTAQQYIVSSSVTYTTQSFSSGSTIFGDTTDDTHQFTGSVDVTGSITTYGDLVLADNSKLQSQNQSTTYIKLVNDDYWQVYANGLEVARFASNQVAINDLGQSAVDFRVEGDTDANLLFTDASADKVGIGTNTPGEKLEVIGNISASGTITGNSIVGTLSTAAQTNITSLGTLTSLTVDNLNLNGSSLTSTVDSDVYLVLGAAGFGFEANSGDSFIFNSNLNNVDLQYSGESDTNVFYIDASTDKVGIGTATPGEKLTVHGNISASGAITASGFTGDGSGLTGVGTVDTSGTPANNQIAVFTDSNTIEGSSNFAYDGTTLNIFGNTLNSGIKFYAGQYGVAGAYISPFGSFSTLNFGDGSTGHNLNMQNNKLMFDSADTYLQADTDNPENLEIHADGNIELRADDNLEIYAPISTNITASGDISSSGALIGNTLTASNLNYPSVDGDNGDVLITDGAGNLSFTRTVVYVNVKNVSGITLAKGWPVHATSSAGNASEVIAASASDATTMPATYILAQELADEEEGLAILTGYINGVDTSLFEEGQVLYVGADGGYTNVKPTGSNLIQNLGIVAKSAVNGSGYVYGSGRSNDVPNISPGYAWVGNSDSVATAVATSSFVVTNANTASYVAASNVDGTVTNASTASYVSGSNIDGAVANATDATNATNVNVGNSDASSTYYILGSLGAGNQALKRDNAITFNASSDTLNVGNLDSAGKIFIGTDNVELRGVQGNFIVYDAGLNVNDGHITASAGHFLGINPDEGAGSSTYLRTSGDAFSDNLKLEFGDLDGNGSETKLVIDDNENSVDITGNTDISGDLSINGIANVSASIAAAGGGGGTTKMYLHANFFLSTSETSKRYVPFNNAVDQASINGYLTQVPVMNAGSVKKISIWPQASSTSFTIGIHKNANTTAIESVTQSTTAGTPITFTFSTNTFAALDEMAFSVTSNHTSNNGINMLIEFENS